MIDKNGTQTTSTWLYLLRVQVRCPNDKEQTSHMVLMFLNNIYAEKFSYVNSEDKQIP